MIIADRVKQLEEEIQSIGERLSGVRSGAINVLDQNVKLDKLVGATYDNLHQHLNNTQSACRLTDGDISDSGSGQIDVKYGTGIIKIVDSAIGENAQFDWTTETNIALTDKSTNWVGIEYDAVTLQGKVKVDVDITNFTFTNDFVLGRVYRDGNTVYILNAGSYYSNFQHKVCYRFFDVDCFTRAAGAVIANEGNLDFSISDGRFYCGTTAFTTAVFDCSGADTFTYWYRDGVGGWTTAAGTGAIDPDHYDDGNPPLGTTSPKKYAVHWIYLCHDGSVHIQYGQGDYKLSEAETALVPATSDFMTYNCKLVGKIISQEGTATLIAVSSAFEEVFIGATASIHNELGGLQGGQADQYYHLNTAEHGYVSGVNAQSLLKTASPQFAKLGIGGAAGTQALEVNGAMIWLNSGSNAYLVVDRSAANRRGVLCLVTAGDPSEAIPVTGLQWCVGMPDSDSVGVDGSEFFIGPATTGATAKFLIKTNGNIGMGKVPNSMLDINLSTEDLEIVDAGSAGATQQDWIQVKVGGNTGYIHVYAAI